MAGVNKVILVGNLGKDPEIRSLESGTKVANFTLATNENYKNKNGDKVEHTEWHNIVVWRGLADIADTYLKKGSQVFIEGRLRTRAWDDKDGNKRYTTEVYADNMVMLGSRQNASSSPAEIKESPVITDIPEPTKDDDLPF